MGLILDAAKSIGKEFLANKVTDILGGSDKTSTSNETTQNDIPVDVSDLISMEDVYEPTVSDADENDPGVVEPENYELEPIEDLEDKRNNLEDFYSTWGDWDMFKQNLKSQQDSEQPLLDEDDNAPVTVDSNDSPTIPDTDDEPVTISQESTQDSTLPQESASVSGSTTIPESAAPLSVPETNNIDKQVEEAIESNPTVAEQVTEDVSGEDSPIETEAEQLNDSNPNNDEVADEAIEQTPIKEKQEILDKLNNAGSSFLTVDDFFNFVDSDTPKGSNIPVDNSEEESFEDFVNRQEQEGDIDFDSFVNSLDDKTTGSKAKETLAKYNKVMQNYPPEVASVLSDKIRNTFTNFARGKAAQATNMANRFSDASELLSAEEGSTITKDEKDFWADRISKALDDPEKLLKNSRGLDLRDPETRKYFEEKFGHDWVRKQDRQNLNKSLRNQNIEIAKSAFKYLDKPLATSSLIGGSSDKPKSKYDLIQDLINGRIDPEKVFTLPSTIKSNGARVSSQLLSKRRAAFDALKTLKENNEIRKYLQSRFDNVVDVSEYWNIPKGELLTNIRKQIVGIPEAEALLSKDNEAEPKLDDKAEVEALEQVEKEYKEDEKSDPLNGGIDWDKVKVYEPGEDGYGSVDEGNIDPNFDADEYFEGMGEYGPGVLKERDEDFLGQDEWVDEEGNIHDYSELANGNTEALDKKWYEGDESGEGEYSESGNVNLDYEAADLQNQIEEAEALPVTNAEEAKEKQNKLRALRLKLKEVQTATGHGSNVPSAGPTTDNGTQTTGGRVSPRAGIGSIGSGAAGHGGMASTSPTKTGDSHNSIASKAPLPQALEDNQGRVVSVNGKATTAPSSNNNGAFRSGSFGLMSKAKSDLKSIPSKAPVSGGAEHMGRTDMSNDLNLEDGKQILIERLKQLLTQLTDEERRKLGFSPALNQWNGKALIRLDGYTLQDLIDKVEEYLGGK